MNEVNWTKQGLAHALNTRMDQGKFPGTATEFLMDKDISDDLLEDWQSFYNDNNTNPLVIENEYARMYGSIVAKF